MYDSKISSQTARASGLSCRQVIGLLERRPRLWPEFLIRDYLVWTTPSGCQLQSPQDQTTRVSHLRTCKSLLIAIPTPLLVYLLPPGKSSYPELCPPPELPG